MASFYSLNSTSNLPSNERLIEATAITSLCCYYTPDCCRLLQISVVWFSLMRIFKKIAQISHRGFLEDWNSQKSVSNIWPLFSCLLDEEIPKIWTKLNSHGGFLRADQGRAKICCQMGWMGCATLQVTQKAIVRIQFLSYFWNPLIK